MNTVFKDMPKNWAVSIAVTVAVCLILSLVIGTMPWYRAMLAAVSAGIGAFASIFLIARRDARLTARMKDDAPSVWDVWMNGVQIGQITDAQYAAIQLHAFRDLRLAVAQALNPGSVALYVAGKVFVGVPLLLFWLLVVTLMVDPECYAEIVQVLRTADLADLTARFGNRVLLVPTLSILTVGLMVVLGSRFGFRNHYAETVARMIRQLCDTPAEGDVHLSRRDTATDTVAHS